MSKTIDYSQVIAKTPILNKIAFGTFALAKLCGLMSIPVAVGGYRYLAGWMLGIYGFLLLLTVIICVFEMNRQNKQDKNNEDLISKLIREGTLKERLKSAGFELIDAK